MANKTLEFIAEIFDISPDGKRIMLCLELPENFRELARRLLWIKRRKGVLKIQASYFLPKRGKDAAQKG